MKDDLSFSDVSFAYMANLQNLDEARQIFEKECRNLNNKIIELVSEKCNSRNKDLSSQLRKKFWWGDATDETLSSRRPGHWINFVQGTSIPMSIKAPGQKNFKNNVAYLHFEVSFDQEAKRHLFKVRFQNDFDKNDQLDEKLHALALAQPEKFRQSKHIKQSCAIIGVWELDQGLVENLNTIILNSLDLVQEMIAQEFPDSLYGQNEEVSPSAEQFKDVA